MPSGRTVIRIIPVVAVLLLNWSTAGAQFFQNVDEWLKQRQAKQPYDTTYIFRPQERWMVRERSMFSGESMTLYARQEDTECSLKLGSGLQFRQSVGVGYRNVSLDIGFNPFKKRRTLDIDLSTYGNRLSFNGYCSLATGIEGTGKVNGTAIEIPLSAMGGTRGLLEFCYAFNGRRFSMPAAILQTYRQRKSAGSLLALASAQFYGVVATDSAPASLPLNNALTALLGLGLGYGYNWVPSEHWLIHLCLTETVGLLNESQLKLNGQEMNFTAKAPVLATNGNMAVYYYYNIFYVGVLARYTNRIHMAIGDADFFNGSTTSVAHLSAGIRF